MKIKMIKTSLGSDRDSRGQAMPVKKYMIGETYDVGESLAKSFMDMKVCQAEGKMEKPAIEDKKIDYKPEKKKVKKKATKKVRKKKNA